MVAVPVGFPGATMSPCSRCTSRTTATSRPGRSRSRYGSVYSPLSGSSRCEPATWHEPVAQGGQAAERSDVRRRQRKPRVAPRAASRQPNRGRGRASPWPRSFARFRRRREAGAPTPPRRRGGPPLGWDDEQAVSAHQRREHAGSARQRRGHGSRQRGRAGHGPSRPCPWSRRACGQAAPGQLVPRAGGAPSSRASSGAAKMSKVSDGRAPGNRALRAPGWPRLCPAPPGGPAAPPPRAPRACRPRPRRPPCGRPVQRSTPR